MGLTVIMVLYVLTLMTNFKNKRYRVCSRTEVDEVPERVEPDLALGQRVRGGVDLDDPLGAELDGFLGALGRLPELALDEHGGARRREPRDRVHGGVDDHLQRGEAGPVGELEEGERAVALLPSRPDPAAGQREIEGARSAAIACTVSGLRRRRGRLGLWAVACLL